MKLRRVIFHPLTVFCIAVSVTLIFAALLVVCSHGRRNFFSLYYIAPIGVPFIAFLFERVEQRQNLPRSVFLIDALTLGVAFARAVIPIPFLSGHSLFLTYALLTTSTTVVRLTCLLVMAQVLYLKLFIWNDFGVFGGIALGVIASALLRIGRGRFLSNK